MIDQILCGTAGGIAALWFILHITIGRKEIARPLRDMPGLDPVMRDTLHLCWHFVTVTVLLMAAFLVIAAATDRQDLAIAGAVLAWGFTLLGVGLVPAVGARYRDLPQGFLFLPIALLGTAGVVL
jgi:hypothetical protein